MQQVRGLAHMFPHEENFLNFNVSVRENNSNKKK